MSPNATDVRTKGSVLPRILNDLNAVAAAVISREGALREANRGFERLLGCGPGSAYTGLDVRPFFINPRFDQFAARQGNKEDGSVLRGIFNIGERDGRICSVNGCVYATGSDLMIIVEHDIFALEKNVAAMQSIANDLADARREIARLERKVHRKDAVTQAAIADREILLKYIHGSLK